ncbi:MAG: CHAT domain-containing protein, partial [Acidobacteriota bacterium]|nr:CHAT domain-containing protein [Acidobacteriota bacterium]
LQRERTLQQQLNVKADRQTRLLSGKHTAEQAVAIRKEIDALTAEYQQVQTQIRQKSPRYAALTQPAPLTLREIQTDVLDADTLLLEYALGEERSYLWAVTQKSITSHELPRRAEVETLARRVYDLLTARNKHPMGETIEQRQARVTQAEEQFPVAASRLSEMLLAPVAAQMRGKRLLIVSDGALQYIPFAALPMPQWAVSGGQSSEKSKDRPLTTDHRPLISEHEIVSLPSASVLAVLRRELRGRRPAPKSVAVLADPVFEKTDRRVRKELARRAHEESGPVAASRQRASAFAAESIADVERAMREVDGTNGGSSIPRLPFSRREAEAILAAAPAGEGMKAIDFLANRQTAISSGLAQYRIVHFATHGLLNSEHPELSGIVLSLVDEQGQPVDGFLRLHEIYNLNLPVEMVVLSACQTALGKEIRGEGLIGLTRGFMYAGSPRVVASLWKVDDVATAELMKHFYRGVLVEGMRPAAALRAAKIEMLKQKRWRAPYYWAAFELQGEWK